MITRLGTFTRYTPELDPDHPFYGQADVLFCRNENGRDWYDMQGDIPPGTWVVGVDAENRVLTVSADPSSIFPAGYTVYALTGAHPADIRPLLGMIFNPATGAFTAPPPPEPVVTAAQAKVALARTKRLADGRISHDPAAEGTPLLILVKERLPFYPLDAQQWYESAQTWRRYNAYVEQIGADIGLNGSDIDNLFAYAATIDA